MEFVELYFLDYKFKIFIDKSLKKRFSLFWKSFLLYEVNFKIKHEWRIYFLREDYCKTKIDYKKKEIYHYQKSVCEITELNNLIRETIVKITAMNGVVWLHCSAFKAFNKTFLVVGNKGDGKTTMMLNAVKKGAEFIGNDQLPIFLYDNKIYTFMWRPDIKICIEDAIKLGLTEKQATEDNEKLLYMVNNNVPYNFIDAEAMSKRINKKITLPDKELNISMAKNKLNYIDYLVFLNNKQELKISLNCNILNSISDDPETILAYKLENIEKYMPYWNKRIKQIQISSVAYGNNKMIIDFLDKQCKKILCGNRLLFDNVWNFMSNL